MEKLSAIQLAKLSIYKKSGALYPSESPSKVPLDVDDLLNLSESEKEKLPPCVINTLENKNGALCHARGKGFSANILNTLGFEEGEAREILIKKLWRNAGGPTTNIFESWFRDELKLPRCEKINRTEAGYPSMTMGDLGICAPDDLCKEIRSPLEYLLRKTLSIEFDGSELKAWINHDGREIGVLKAYRDVNVWRHEFEGETNTARSILGLFGGKRTRRRKRTWLWRAVNDNLEGEISRDTFNNQIYYPLVNEIQTRGILERSRDAPPRQAYELLNMIKSLTIVRSVDGELNFPVILKVEYGKKTRELELNSKSLLSLRSIKSAFLQTFLTIPEQLSDISGKIWEKDVIAQLNETDRIRAIHEDVSTQQYLVDRVKQEVQEATLTKDREKVITRPHFALLQEDLVWIPNTRLKGILEEERSRVNLKKLRSWLGDAVREIRVFRTEAGSERLWGFVPERCGRESLRVEES